MLVAEAGPGGRAWQVAAHLRRTQPAGVEVQWLNEAGESGASCDIITRVSRSDPIPTPPSRRHCIPFQAPRADAPQSQCP